MAAIAYRRVPGRGAWADAGVRRAVSGRELTVVEPCTTISSAEVGMWLRNHKVGYRRHVPDLNVGCKYTAV